MAASEQALDDRQSTIRRILKQRGSSLACELRDIQKHAENVEKAHKWADNPLCLRYQISNPSTFRCIRNRKLEDPFVAISWTWEPSAHESNRSGKYSVQHSHTGEVEKVDIRNCVLDRVIKYLVFMGHDIFWIDKICINQKNEKMKEEAINSMDLVYKRAAKSVALLSSPIQSQDRLDVLVRLVDGGLSFRSGNRCMLRRYVSRARITKAIRLLRRVTKDLWWTRGWTFQEEYVAGMNMDILLPLVPGLGSTPGNGHIPGEYCVSAARFREQVTIFSQACLDSDHNPRHPASRLGQAHKRMCNKILSVVAKYNIILTGPMSARIHADVGRRNITKPWDSLAIIANSCGYGIRLNREALVENGKSLSMCLLAQYLINGEIVSWSQHSEDILDLSIAKFLETVSMTPANLPVLSRQLTFLKCCRLATVELCSFGIRTEGFLWDLRAKDSISTSRFQLPQIPDARREYLQSHPWETLELETLACELDKAHGEVADRLRDYIRGRRLGYDSQGSDYMDLMAWDVVRAIEQRHVLRIGYLDGERAGSIFVPSSKDIWRSMLVFTAWRFGQCFEYGLDNYVCVEVSTDPEGILNPLQWIRGLLFFAGMQPRRRMFGRFWT